MLGTAIIVNNIHKQTERDIHILFPKHIRRYVVIRGNNYVDSAAH